MRCEHCGRNCTVLDRVAPYRDLCRSCDDRRAKAEARVVELENLIRWCSVCGYSNDLGRGLCRQCLNRLGSDSVCKDSTQTGDAAAANSACGSTGMVQPGGSRPCSQGTETGHAAATAGGRVDTPNENPGTHRVQDRRASGSPSALSEQRTAEPWVKKYDWTECSECGAVQETGNGHRETCSHRPRTSEAWVPCRKCGVRYFGARCESPQCSNEARSDKRYALRARAFFGLPETERNEERLAKMFWQCECVIRAEHRTDNPLSCMHEHFDTIATPDGIRETLWCEDCGAVSPPGEEWRLPKHRSETPLVEAERDRAVALVYQKAQHEDEMASEAYGKGREADGNRHETAAEALRDVGKWIARGCQPKANP